LGLSLEFGLSDDQHLCQEKYKALKYKAFEFANSIGTFFETIVAQTRRKTCGDESGYKLWATEKIGNLDKLREAIMLKCGMLTEILHIEGRDFYPELAQVGTSNTS
jgi:hypothetical protein